MLVLSRQLGEQICVGDDIVITVTEIREGAVKIGIEAPRSIPVHRREVQNRIDRGETWPRRREGGVA